jgi:hypothetical protein
MPRARLVTTSTTTALALLLAACGSSDPSTTPDAASNPTIDAKPSPPDAVPTPYGCLGDPLPTTAPSSIKLSGKTVAVSGTSSAPVADVAVSAFIGANPTAVASTTSTAGGDYAVDIATSNKPVDAYLRAHKSGDLDMYLYAAAPLAHDGPNASLVLVTQSDLGYLALGAGLTQSSSKGFVTVIVLDCLGNAISGATVTASPSTGATIRYLAGGQPSKTATTTDASGTALIFNAPAGNVEIGASVSGMTLRAHTLDARAGAVTATVVKP